MNQLTVANTLCNFSTPIQLSQWHPCIAFLLVLREKLNEKLMAIKYRFCLAPLRGGAVHIGNF
jgi:hypothetical protein